MKTEDYQPKPTGEWSVEVQERYLRIVDSAGNKICDSSRVFTHIVNVVVSAHNAALAVRQQHIDNLDAALSAERTRHDNESANIHIEHYFPKDYDPDAEPWKSIRKHHNAALAAERESSKVWREDWRSISERHQQEMQQLREQLATAMVELSQISKTDPNPMRRLRADAALAKITDS